MCVAAAIAGGALGSAAIGAVASKSAAGAQSRAAGQANETQMAMYNQTNANLSPYRGVGNQASQALAGYYGLDGAVSQGRYQQLLQNLPGYQFQLNSGSQAVDRNLAAQGLLQSGAAGKALTQYGQGLGQSYGQQYAQGLGGLAGLGESAAAQTGAFGANAANQIGSNTIYGGNAQAQGTINQANSWQSGLQGLAGAYGYSQSPGAQQANSLYVDPRATYNSSGVFTGLAGLSGP